MRLRNITGSEEVIANSEYVIHEPSSGKWKEIFGNDHPVYIEIGMGKGRFIIDNALKYPDVNFIGIEKYSSVLLRALQKLDAMETVPSNLRFLCIDAKEITEYFGKGEVDKIYLNFSDPWPKDRHAKRRLPSRQFLSLYDVILNKEGKLEFKTDNRGLFDFAIEELEPAGWKAEAVTYDLHADAVMSKDNIMTEYEEKFSSIGNPICKYIISR
ncbi:MAG: tRNA (guanosine(46)-N7)-methyltransferase TrmB [Lachnospiraceae bacterium]|nr:tRNA (guanosine(46)-N7)-methyltransferase TrmB [Lachnospiraceae bacterium]MBR5760981.1 tRNA (guanosine(46)-N7)-methyltransferase TrmB [Lachnospiraceae bacterium]MBR5992682.1 tRNA (guanosine(46)-N7)-methyltransferase TrmB [Lachnospiraceae bacterium]